MSLESVLIVLAVVAQSSDAAVQCRYARMHPERFALPPAAMCATTLSAKAGSLIPLALMTGRQRRVWSSVLIGSGAVGMTVTLAIGGRK